MNGLMPAYDGFDVSIVLGSLARESRAPGPRYLDHSRRTLEMLLSDPEILRDVELERSPGRYARNLLFGKGDVSVWAMTWAPGSQTSIHDHHCSCCFGVVSGAITEVRYRAIDNERAVESGRHLREAGFIACLLPSGPNIHQMVNESDCEAISIHIYGYDHTILSSSVEREYRRVVF